MTTTDIIRQLPFEIQARLLCDEYLSDIPVVVAEEGNIGLTVKQRLVAETIRAGKRGLGIVVLQLLLDDRFPNLQFGPITFRPALQVVENLELNRGPAGSGKAARQISRRIRDIFKGSFIGGLTKVWECEADFMIPVALPEKYGENVKAYQVQFECMESATETSQQVALPAVAPVEGLAQVTLSCATPGAAIWFTTDDTYPVPTTAVPESTAQLYAAPIPIPETGLVLRAAAYLAGYIASSAPRFTIAAE